jgi:hypothetical protein
MINITKTNDGNIYRGRMVGVNCRRRRGGANACIAFAFAFALLLCLRSNVYLTGRMSSSTVGRAGGDEGIERRIDDDVGRSMTPSRIFVEPRDVANIGMNHNDIVDDDDDDDDDDDNDKDNEDDDADRSGSSISRYDDVDNDATVGSSSSNQNRTLAVISACIPGDRFDAEYINASLSNKQRYCDRWEAICILSRERGFNNQRPGGGGTNRRDYSPKWEKLHSIINTMELMTHVDWLLWLDCDAAFTNYDIDWRIHMNDYLDDSRVLLASRDDNGINLGVFLLPNTPYARFFVEMMLEERHDVERRGLFHKDQNALKNLLEKSSQLKRSINDGVPQGMINSVSSFLPPHRQPPKKSEVMPSLPPSYRFVREEGNV